VQVFEWDDGKLSNAGEKIQISMPGDVDTQLRRQWIRVDRVNYSDGSHPISTDPWPFNPPEYGNDPINWKAATPSPGAANP